MNKHEVLALIQAHEDWLYSGEEQGRQLSLEDLDLSGLDLSGRVLDQAELPGARFDHCRLVRVEFGKAFLHSASFDEADLTETLLLKATLDHASLKGSILRRTFAMRATFIDADLTGAILDEANLVRALLVDTNLERASLREANLEVASINAVRLTGADLRGARHVSTVYMKSIHIGTELQPVILEGEQARQWLLQQAEAPPAERSGLTPFEVVVLKLVDQLGGDETLFSIGERLPPWKDLPRLVTVHQCLLDLEALGLVHRLVEPGRYTDEWEITGAGLAALEQWEETIS